MTKPEGTARGGLQKAAHGKNDAPLSPQKGG